MSYKILNIVILVIFFQGEYCSLECKSFFSEHHEKFDYSIDNFLFEENHSSFYLISKKSSHYLLQLNPFHDKSQNQILRTHNLKLHQTFNKKSKGKCEAKIFIMERHFIPFVKFLASQENINPLKIVAKILKDLSVLQKENELGFVSFKPEALYFDVHLKKFMFLYAKIKSEESEKTAEGIASMIHQIFSLIDLLYLTKEKQKVPIVFQQQNENQSNNEKEQIKNSVLILKENGFDLQDFFQKIKAKENNSLLFSEMFQSHSFEILPENLNGGIFNKLTLPIIYGLVLILLFVGIFVVFLIYWYAQRKSEQRRNSDFGRRVLNTESANN